jgi:hypothetical protein
MHIRDVTEQHRRDIRCCPDGAVPMPRWDEGGKLS